MRHLGENDEKYAVKIASNNHVKRQKTKKTKEENEKTAKRKEIYKKMKKELDKGGEGVVLYRSCPREGVSLGGTAVYLVN